MYCHKCYSHSIKQSTRAIGAGSYQITWRITNACIQPFKSSKCHTASFTFFKLCFSHTKSLIHFHISNQRELLWFKVDVA